MRAEPALSVVEAAYRLEGDESAWLDGMVQAAAPLSDTDMGVMAVLYEPEPAPFHARVVSTRYPDRDRLVEAFLNLEQAAKMDPNVAPVLHRTTICESTTEAIVRMGRPVELIDQLYSMDMHGLGVRDSFNVQGIDLKGRALCLMAGRSQHTQVPSTSLTVWRRVAVHLSAALRLRAALKDLRQTAVLDGANAVFDAQNLRCLHLAPAQAGDLAALRSAARTVDRARSRNVRTDAEQALELWRGLFAGRYSLADVFDSDGRRFVVAYENEPDVARDRRLTRRERQAVALAATGHADALGSYALGVTTSTFRRHLGRALKKLGVRDRTILVDLVTRFEALSGEPA